MTEIFLSLTASIRAESHAAEAEDDVPRDAADAFSTDPESSEQPAPQPPAPPQSEARAQDPLQAWLRETHGISDELAEAPLPTEEHFEMMSAVGPSLSPSGPATPGVPDPQPGLAEALDVEAPEPVAMAEPEQADGIAAGQQPATGIGLPGREAAQADLARRGVANRQASDTVRGAATEVVNARKGNDRAEADLIAEQDGDTAPRQGKSAPPVQAAGALNQPRPIPPGGVASAEQLSGDEGKPLDQTATTGVMPWQTGAAAKTSAFQAGPETVGRIARQIGEAVVTTRTGSTEIALAPAELGKLRITIVGTDRLQIAIWAERPETMDLLRRHSDDLNADLREAGVSTDLLDFRDGPPPDDRRDSAPGQSSHWRVLADAQAEPSASVSNLAIEAARLAGNRRIDVRL